jgi:hypothetical protein
MNLSQNVIAKNLIINMLICLKLKLNLSKLKQILFSLLNKLLVSTMSNKKHNKFPKSL